MSLILTPHTFRASPRTTDQPTATLLCWPGFSPPTSISAWCLARSYSLCVTCCRDCSSTESCACEVWPLRFDLFLLEIFWSENTFCLPNPRRWGQEDFLRSAVNVVFLCASYSDCMSCFFSVAPQPTAHRSVHPRERWVHPGSLGPGDITLYGK